MPFTLGQRWSSDTESELGLGTGAAVDARTVTLLFPATGENRLYARSLIHLFEPTRQAEIWDAVFFLKKKKINNMLIHQTLTCQERSYYPHPHFLIHF
ncbi:hypothetical protein HIJ85_21170 [Cronobacter sakazakii]|nr:hypothetical protein [Cronobacter sakazakii]